MSVIKDSKVIIEEVVVADNVLTRLKGLMGKKEVPMGGLLITPCNSIHTFFMKMKIDVVFLDKNNVILDVKEDMNKRRMSKVYMKATKVLELSSGEVKRLGLKKGDVLRIVN